VLDRYVRAVLSGRYATAKEATRLCLSELRRRHAGPDRTFQAVFARTCEKLRDAGKRRSHPWTWKELQVIERSVRDVVAGRTGSVAEAARTCLERLRTLRRTERPSIPPPGSSMVYQAVWVRTREARDRGLNTEWSSAEDRVVTRFARDLLKGRYASVQQAAVACTREFERHAGRRKGSRAWKPRTLGSVANRVNLLSHKIGRPAWRTRFRPWEQEVIDDYVQALAGGRYLSLLRAAQDCCQDLNRLRREHRADRTVVRKVYPIRWQLSKRARALGWNWLAERWTPEERRIVDRYVRKLTGPNPPVLKAATRACWKELEKLHRRMKKQGHDFQERTEMTLRTYLGERSKDEGRSTYTWWTSQEEQAIRRYARGLLRERYADANAAGDACYEELFGGGRPAAGTGRTRIAVRDHVRKLAHTMGERWPKTRWTPKEDEICLRLVRWYDRKRGKRRRGPMGLAAEALRTELDQIGSRRSESACRAKLRKTWREVHGVDR
jgi:hypothetical protein